MWSSSLGLIVLMQSVLLCYSALFDNSDFNYYVDDSRNVIYNSPNYPSKYGSGSSGRATFKTKAGYSVKLTCDINVDKTSSGCSTENLYISSDADPNLRGASQFCGSGRVERESEYSKISIAHVSTASTGSGIGGKYTCLVSSQKQPCDCGWSQRGRIVGGTDSSPTEFPGVVSLMARRDSSLFCGGSIISSRDVITAAHCIDVITNRDPSQVFMVAGCNSLGSPYCSTYTFSQIIVHPNYNPTSQQNDIAIMRTIQPIEWSRAVGPICLPFEQYTFDFMRALLVGWGSTSFGGPKSSNQKKADVTIIRNSDCATQYPISTSQVCSYGNGKDACQYDSGGPLIITSSLRQYLIGVINYGSNCGGTTAGVNARVTSFISFIQNNSIGELCHKQIQA